MEHRPDLLKKNALLQTLFDNCRIGLVILDEQLRAVSINPRMYEFFELPPADDIADRSLGRMLCCSSLDAGCSECGNMGNYGCGLMKSVDRLKRNGVVENSSICFSTKKGTKNTIKWFQLNGTQIACDEQIYYLLYFTDITDLKRNEAHFRALLSLDLATGTVNKSGLVELIKKYARAEEIPRYSLCMIDFDNFKRLNDGYGHLFGDNVLRKFADISRRRIRKGDVLGRYGGEEFVFIFDDTDEKQAAEVLKRIHIELTNYFSGICGQPVTFSAGIVSITKDAPRLTYKELLDRADRLLYQAKRLGRSRAISVTREFVFSETQSDSR